MIEQRVYNHIVQSCLMLSKFNTRLVSALSEWNLQLDHTVKNGLYQP